MSLNNKPTSPIRHLNEREWRELKKFRTHHRRFAPFLLMRRFEKMGLVTYGEPVPRTMRVSGMGFKVTMECIWTITTFGRELLMSNREEP